MGEEGKVDEVRRWRRCAFARGVGTKSKDSGYRSGGKRAVENEGGKEAWLPIMINLSEAAAAGWRGEKDGPRWEQARR